LTNRGQTPPEDLLRRLFVEEFQRVKATPVPECEPSFYPYRGLTSTIRSRNGRVLVRVSDLLTDAPPEILRSVMAILINKLFRSQVDEEIRLRYRRFVNRPEFRQQVNQIRRQRGAKRISSSTGQVFNLTAMFQELNKTYFDNKIMVRHLSWSQKAGRTTLGHFDSAHEAIIVNKRLDNPRVPRYVVSYVLYHEMLHAFLGEELTRHGRRIHHSRFREAEKRFQDYSKAKAFIEDHFHGLKLS